MESTRPKRVQSSIWSKPPAYSVRKPREYRPESPGDLIEVNTIDIRRFEVAFHARSNSTSWDYVYNTIRPHHPYVHNPQKNSDSCERIPPDCLRYTELIQPLVSPAIVHSNSFRAVRQRFCALGAGARIIREKDNDQES